MLGGADHGQNALAEGIDMKIDVGWLKEDGMHLSGAMTLDTAEVKTGDPSPSQT